MIDSVPEKMLKLGGASWNFPVENSYTLQRDRPGLVVTMSVLFPESHKIAISAAEVRDNDSV